VRTRRIIIIVGVVALLGLYGGVAVAAGEAPTARKSIELGVGIVGSSGFGDALERRFPPDRYEMSGTGTLFDVECGFGFETGTHVTVTPRLRLLAKSVTISAYQGLPGSDYAALVFLPGVSVRYAFARDRSPFYVCGDLAFVSGHADEEVMTFEGRGVSLGAAVGVSFGRGKVDFELGYWTVPVRETEPDKRDADFGGVGVVVRTRWFL
jgi:hypothetical protein